MSSEDFKSLRKKYVNFLSQVPTYANFWEDTTTDENIVFKKEESYKVLGENQTHYFIQHPSKKDKGFPIPKSLEEKNYTL